MRDTAIADCLAGNLHAETTGRYETGGMIPPMFPRVIARECNDGAWEVRYRDAGEYGPAGQLVAIYPPPRAQEQATFAELAWNATLGCLTQRSAIDPGNPERCDKCGEPAHYCVCEPMET